MTDDRELGIVSRVSQHEYPGRGLAIGRDVRGVPFVAYWLTGRSPASKAREIVLSETAMVVRDLTGGPVDDLRHYTAALRSENRVVIGNGTQVADVERELERGRDFTSVLSDLRYEPDPPINTPRIVGTAQIDRLGLRHVIVASARSHPRWPESPQHPSLHAPELEVGQCFLVNTYAGPADDPVPSGIPRNASVAASWEDLAQALWSALDADLRVAVMVAPLLDPSLLAARVIPQAGTGRRT